MMEELSLFGRNLASGSGIEHLMDDLSHALATGKNEMRMLGGGNPAFIPEMEAVWRKRMAEILEEPRSFERILGTYDPPKGNQLFATALASLLRKEFGWQITADNIAVTNGGQAAFFALFNLLGGSFPNGRFKSILLPQGPEYIGYANQSASAGLFTAISPKIQFSGNHRFKYYLDFEQLHPTRDTIGAICVSRPTNPSGNVLTDEEMLQLDVIAQDAGVPLLVDNAYGAPFPGILFKEITPHWNENTIFVLSLSKFGLPGLRTGFVVARPEIIRALASFNAVTQLANGSLGQAMLLPLVESGEILRLARDVVRPYYEKKSLQAQRWIREAFDDTLDYLVHESEGALFLWLWFRNLPISSMELYERLRQRGVLVVSGHYFGYGGAEIAAHCQECIRLNFAMDDQTVQSGIGILADEIRRIYRSPN